MGWGPRVGVLADLYFPRDQRAQVSDYGDLWHPFFPYQLVWAKCYVLSGDFADIVHEARQHLILEANHAGVGLKLPLRIHQLC
jgi:hypothetical protein